ncbi:alpha/beta hydrolase [Belliella kenyensis]|uniref:Alpha/beta hydrolase n=1 Tax=Belliella kenyensis TaxID=1472724 RepID=A0ABV8ERE6_9BACT|nr:alpha/beta hydrolase [Belliella kenyensis]MCH7401932.1 alpha/beta hydrolase [Belliella kenyensis]MDN3605096.1 alpha/beta hydrolase [Belliella kenyensis]
MLKKIIPFIMAIAITLVIAYAVGPKASIERLDGTYPTVTEDLSALEDFIKHREDTISGLKPNNEAKIIWADSANKQKTKYSIVYIHGFGASEMEGNPVNREVAAHFESNLFLVRLPEHGIQRDDAMKHLSAAKLMESAREAFMIGKSLGDSVIVIGTSMGGALALNLAAERPDIKAVVLYSPAIAVWGDQLDQFFQPWVKTYAEKFMFPNGVQTINRTGDKAKYWSDNYHVNGYESLAVLLKSTMHQGTFANIHQPLFLGYYYKNDQEQDFVVSVPKMIAMFDQVNTADSLKAKIAFPEARDHVIASDITSKDWQNVLNETIQFLEQKAKVSKPNMIIEEGKLVDSY